MVFLSIIALKKNNYKNQYIIALAKKANNKKPLPYLLTVKRYVRKAHEKAVFVIYTLSMLNINTIIVVT